MNIGRSFMFDYQTRRFAITGGAVEECTGIDALKQWLQLLIRTSPGSAAVYEITDDTAFGVSLDRMIGRRYLPTEFVRAELERQIREACALNPAIESVSDFKFSRHDMHTMQVAFTVHTVSDENEEVTLEYGI
ncbi:MAG: DUF2634 domain-containing protein [Eubacteriales bacterium]|nr:DUF2634 domain-containing protein [Eubacteriales bacterium]